MPEDIKALADLNSALPIGYGQTISQPLVVAFMLELLQPEPGQKILDVGSGSGWTTTLLAYIVSQEGNSKSETLNSKQTQNSKLKSQNHNSKIKTGKVIAMEIIPELKEFGETNAARYNFIKKGIARFVCEDASGGYPKEAPFDRILASAMAHGIPSAWKEQLKTDGIIVAPVGSSIWRIIKKGRNEFEEKEYPGFSFVPLVQNSKGE